MQAQPKFHPFRSSALPRSITRDHLGNTMLSVLARFISADTVVPGAGALKGLTVDFHEPGFVAQLGGENNQPFWFQLSDDDK